MCIVSHQCHWRCWNEWYCAQPNWSPHSRLTFFSQFPTDSLQPTGLINITSFSVNLFALGKYVWVLVFHKFNKDTLTRPTTKKKQVLDLSKIQRTVMKCISAAWISYLPHGCSGLTESLLQSRKFSRRTRRSCRIVTGSHWSCPPTVSLCSDDTWLSRQATKYSEEESSWCSRCRRPRSLVVSLRGEFISVCSPGQAASSHLRTAKTGHLLFC